MKSPFPIQKEVNRLARSKWIDDLSEEETKVLIHAHSLDKSMANGGKKIKIGLLEDLCVE